MHSRHALGPARDRDAGWRSPDAPVLAIRDGVVRLAEPSAPTWGGLVVLEHDEARGRACTLYGHLGPLLAVRPGDTVAAGDLLGAVGRGLSPENGGYGVHLHLGVHDGPWGDGRWVTGYVRDHTPQEAGWRDPVAAIAAWRGAPGAP